MNLILVLLLVYQGKVYLNTGNRCGPGVSSRAIQGIRYSQMSLKLVNVLAKMTSFVLVCCRVARLIGCIMFQSQVRRK